MMERIVLVFGILLSISILSMAEPKKYPSVADLQVDAESIGTVVLGQKIRLSMHDGSYLEGKVLRAGRKEIVIRISKSEPNATSVFVQKGREVSLKTSDIGMVHLRRSGSVAAPVALGVIGGILGAAATGYLLRNEQSAAGLTGFVAGAAGGAAGGALLGRQVVQKTVSVYIVPNNH